MSDAEHPLMRSFGRIKSRPIKPRQAALMDELLPKIRVPQAHFEPRALKAEATEVWVEIGFGGGEHMAAQARRRPDVLVIGAEPFLNGVASAVRHVDEQGLSNIRIQDGDARLLLQNLPDGCLDRVFILFPDPWQKARHHKRRIIQSDFVEDLARVLKPGGRLRFASDWENYVEWTLEALAASSCFRPLRAPAELRTAPDDHVTTRYETKRLGDCAPAFLDYERL
jgi:tRNA (guanine-N7-)-methyltransferase